MCAWAISIAQIKRVVIGARYADLDRLDLGRYRFEDFMAYVGKEVELITGVKTEECVSALSP